MEELKQIKIEKKTPKKLNSQKKTKKKLIQNQKTIQEKIINDTAFRKQLAKKSFYWFFHIYFPHYVKHPTAEFQREIYNILQNDKEKFVEIIAFRGSSKSTLSILALPIWSVITKRAKFPILFSDTFGQVKQHIYNLKTELENNKLLIADWGPFINSKEEWTATDIVLSNYEARITAKSTGQKVRGIRHKQYRPDLAVADDVENVETVRTKEQRDKDERWLMSEVLPALDINAKVVIIGNLLHSDSLMMRIRNSVITGQRNGIVKEYPFFKSNNEPYWKEKFNTKELIEAEMKKYGGAISKTWQREFLLKIIAEEGQEVKEDWIKYYDKEYESEVMHQASGVDLAISKKQTADLTAIVSGKLYEIGGQPKIQIMPFPTNARLSQHETVEAARAKSMALGNGTLTDLFVEDVGYQKAAVEAMERVGLPAIGVHVSTDKRARLRTVATYIQNGTVEFSITGCEDLILQLTGFGVEAHDDLCDSFVLLVMGLMNDYAGKPKMTII